MAQLESRISIKYSGQRTDRRYGNSVLYVMDAEGANKIASPTTPAQMRTPPVLYNSRGHPTESGIPPGGEAVGKGAMINQERLVDSFCGLVRIDSPSDEEENVAQHLVARLGGLGFKVERDAHGNVIATEAGDNPLLLSAHMDTVEPGRGIKPTIQGERIVSDGTTILGGDCKAGVSAILEGLESVAESGMSRRPVQVVFTRGEEIGLVGATNLDYSMITGQRVGGLRR